MGFCLKYNQQKCYCKKNEHNPIGKAEPGPAVHELTGHKSILRQNRQQRRQTVICSIRSQ